MLYMQYCRPNRKKHCICAWAARTHIPACSDFTSSSSLSEFCCRKLSLDKASSAVTEQLYHEDLMMTMVMHFDFFMHLNLE